jgi:hypothetical protein
MPREGSDLSDGRRARWQSAAASKANPQGFDLEGLGENRLF